MVRLLFSLALLAAVASVGCDKATPKAQVRGTVTLDKKLLPEGQILFVTPGKPPEALPITNGNYEGTVEVGARRVEILAYKTAAAVPMQGETFEPTKVNYLPPRYNTDSSLKADVTASGSNEFKFELKSSQ
jgi:hypothetical protein